MKTFSKITAVLLVLILSFSLCACGGGGNIAGSWKTRPQTDENGEVIAIPDDEVQLFTFNAGGTGNLTLPEYGETVIMSFDWKTSGKTLTITAGDDEVYKFTYRIKDHVLSITPENGEQTFEYIKVS